MSSRNTKTNNGVAGSRQRRRIIEIAKKNFCKHGYRATTMRDLAKACRMTTGGLYHYFATKHDILHAIALDSQSRTHILNEFYEGLGKVDSYAEALSKCIGKYLDIVVSEGDSVRFYDRELRNFTKKDREQLLGMQVNVVDVFKDLLLKGTKAGEFEISDPVFVAHSILMLGNVYETRRWFVQKQFALEDYKKLFADSVLKIVSPACRPA